VRTFAYDAANRLTSVTSGTLTTTFEYDGLPAPVAHRPGTGQAQVGNRTAQTVGGVTTEYVLDVAGGLPEVIVATTGGASTRYVQVQGQILAEYEAGAWGYVLPDHLGSVRQLVGSDSQVDLAQSFDPFGVLFETSGSGESDFAYTGEGWDSEAGVLYLRARCYEPGVGRFTSWDRFAGDFNKPQTLNGWSYADGNPINLVDPAGLYSMKEIKGFFYNAPTYLHVLRYFERGGGLEGRWGWLEVLRKAEDGDQIQVFEAPTTNPCADTCAEEVDQDASWQWPDDRPVMESVNSCPKKTAQYYGGTWILRRDMSGMFQSRGGRLVIVGFPEYPHDELSHFQVALGGKWYRLRTKYYYADWTYYPLGRWTPIADINAKKKYWDLRHDAALASLQGAGASLAGIVAPGFTEEIYAIAIQVFDEAQRNGMIDAQGELTQEASILLMKTLAERLDPKALVALELLDLSLDINELGRELGFIWAP
jgi:RHS repeat-associated protein